VDRLVERRMYWLGISRPALLAAKAFSVKCERDLRQVENMESFKPAWAEEISDIWGGITVLCECEGNRGFRVLPCTSCPKYLAGHVRADERS
jgi:hypothetical protein